MTENQTPEPLTFEERIKDEGKNNMENIGTKIVNMLNEKYSLNLMTIDSFAMSEDVNIEIATFAHSINSQRIQELEEVLKDAAERAKLAYDPINQVYSVDKQSILETPLD